MGTLKKNKIRFERAEDISALLNFKCGIKQMDDFIRNKHKGLQKHIELGLSHLWLVYEKEKVIAFFALSKDALTLKACSKNSPQRFNRCSLYCSSLSFCFYLASFAFSFSRIVHYAPSRSKQNLLS